MIVIVILNVMKKYLPTCYYNDQSVEENYGAPTIKMAKMKAEIFNLIKGKTYRVNST